MTRAKDISKIVTDADLSGTLDVTGTVTAGGLDIQGDGTISGGSRLTISDIADENNDGIRLDDSTTARYNNLTQDSSGNFKIQHWTGSAWQNNFTLTTGGNVGIGTSSPSGKLDVTQGTSPSYFRHGTGTYLNITTGAANGTVDLKFDASSGSYPSATFYTSNTERMRIDSSGRVGIGISSPSALLQVVGADGVNGGAIMYSASGVASGYMSADAAGLCLATDTAGITFRTGISPVDPTDTGSERLRINSSGNVGINTTTPAATLHTVANSGTTGLLVTGAASNNIASFYTSGSSQAMTLDSSGNVGIGTSSPSGAAGTTLAINGASGQSRLALKNTSTGDASGDGFQLSIGTDGSVGIEQRENNYMALYTNATERMRIHSGGQLSLATTDATHGFNVGQSGTDFRGRFQGNNQYRLGLQNGTNDLVWLGSGGANNFRISNAGGSTLFEIDGSGVVKNTDFIIPFPAGAAPSGTFTHYNNGSQQTTDASHQNMPVACALKVKAIYLYVNGVLATGSATVSLQKNAGAVTSISVTTGVNAFNSTGLSISYVAGDRMGIKIVGTGTTAAWYNVSVLCERA